jgi:hypothetical protein
MRPRQQAVHLKACAEHFGTQIESDGGADLFRVSWLALVLRF